MKKLCLALAPLLLSVGCLVVGPGDGDSAVVADSGGSDGGASDSASRDTASGTDSNAGHDAGAGVDILAFDVMGFDISGFDAGIAEYDGGAEPGVVCSTETCVEGAPCCAGLFGTTCGSIDAGCTASPYSIPIPCDGTEDCGDGEECCVVSASMTNYSVSCVTAGTCAGSTVCVNSEECSSGSVCCSASAMASFGVEVGWCEVDRCGN